MAPAQDTPRAAPARQRRCGVEWAGVNTNDFVAKWRGSAGRENASVQSHFNDLCALVREDDPNKGDPSQTWYTFERQAARSSGAGGRVDVWLKDKFAWEYKGKGKHKDLRAAYKQCLDYHEALGNPPLLVVCDFDRFEIHTKFTNRESWTYSFDLSDLLSNRFVMVTTSAGETPPDAPNLRALDVLRALWADPSRLKPSRTTEEITAEAASMFEGVVAELRRWGNTDDQRIARFVSRMVFCMFASDIGLLPRGAFSELLAAQATNAGAFRDALADLFHAMAEGGRFGPQTIPQVNGDLFTDRDVPDDLTTQEIRALRQLDTLNWSEVEPTIFGALFERILDQKSRAALGAHYTSREDIETLVKPVLMAPLRREWEAVRKAAEEAVPDDTQRTRVAEMVDPFLKRLANVTVLDPACGSGNFLYVSLALLKGLEKEAIAWAGERGVALEPCVHPRQLHGIEIDEYAHQLASMVVWIGYLQWKYRNAIPLEDEKPILQKLEAIRLMDAIVDRSHPKGPREPAWPEADVIVGNPPFLGGKRLRTELRDDYVEALFQVWDGQVQHSADLCCYWHEKARRMVQAGKAKRVGLLATQAIRGPASRGTLERIKQSGDFFFAESNRAWILDGAAVRVSMVGFDDGTETERILDGQSVDGINVNLTSGLPLTEAAVLAENRGIAFMGVIRIGRFEIDGQLAREMLAHPNPDGRDNADIVRPWWIASDLVDHPRDMWIIDFPPGTPLEEAQLYEAPFRHVAEHVQPFRANHKQDNLRDEWWILGAPRPPMRRALRSLPRFIATGLIAKHRTFSWVGGAVLPDARLIVFARDDDYFFGVLHSRLHELWALHLGSRHGDGGSDGGRPTYNNTTCFLTFPLPWPPGEEPTDGPLVRAIAEKARQLHELREGWLNPPGPLVADRGQRTLTNLYNERPAWLDTAHRELDEAVFAAYGWPPDLSDEETLARLLALNLERARGS